MARLLQPQDYGVMAMATVVTGLIAQGQSLGVAQALVQRDKVTAPNEQVAFTVVFGFSCALFLLLCLASGLVAEFYDDTRVAPVLCVLALSFPLSAFSVVPGAMLRREMLAKGEAATNLMAMVAESLTMLILAWQGRGVWSLAFGQLAAVVTRSLALSYFRPWRLGLRVRGGDLRSIMKFGGGSTLSGMLYFAYQNADNLIIGRVLGSSALGLYSIGWKLAKLPYDRLWYEISGLLLPLYSRARSEAGGLAGVVSGLSRFSAIVTVPAVAGMGAVAVDAVHVLLGDQWGGAASPLVWLSIYMSVRAVVGVLPFALQATGRLREDVAFNLICAVILPAGFLFNLQWGIVGVAATWAVLFPVIAAVWLIPRALDAAGLSPRDYLRAVWGPMCATAVMVLCVVGVNALMPVVSPMRLVVKVGVGAAVYACALRVLEGPLAPQVAEVMTKFRGRK